MTNADYWKKREEEAKQHYLTEESEILASLNRKYNYLQTEIEKEINGFYAKYAKAEGLTMAEAQQAVSKMDVQAFAEKARRYVKTRDFSPKANAELKLYNATMKINRLELLKANIGLEIIDAFNEIDAELQGEFENRAMEEFDRQAGILGDSVKRSGKNAMAIVNASFHHATFSERIWMYQKQLKNALDDLLTNGIVQGYNPRVLATHLVKAFGASRANAERLMRTEMARVQTEAQKQSFDANGFDQYMFLALGNACEICKTIDGEVFNVKDMQPGDNAPPMHPNCRCSTAAYMDRVAVERELFSAEMQSFTTVTEKMDGYYDYYNISPFKHARFRTGGLSPEEYALSKARKSFEKYDRHGIINMPKEKFVKTDFSEIKYLEGKLGNYDVRLWYDKHLDNIIELLNPRDTLELQARTACALRNQYRTEARRLMADQKAVEELNATKENLTFDDLVKKANAKGLYGDDAYRDIIRSSMHHNEDYDRKAGL